jgi:AhpD family alkylhydroperoxidase
MATSPASDYEATRRDIEETFGIVPGWLDALPPEDLVHEWPLNKRYLVGEWEIPPKYRELIGLAVAANIKCQYCMHFHREAAKLHGATEEELAELSMLASITPRYSAMLHAQHYDLDEFESETAKIGAHFEAQLADADD